MTLKCEGVYTDSGLRSSVYGLRSTVLAPYGARPLLVQDLRFPMSRDHRKLRVFHDAHSLTLAIYQHTRNFPKDEWFGNRSQFVAQRSPSPAISLKEMRAPRRATISNFSTSRWGRLVR